MSSGRRRLFLNGVSVVLCGDSENFRGASIAWATKIERDHALVSLPGHAGVTDDIRNSDEFTINVLAADQSNIARQYGGSSQSDPHEVQRGDLEFGRWKVPIVKAARAQLLCEFRQAIAVRKQLLVIAEISDFVFADDREPLVYIHE